MIALDTNLLIYAGMEEAQWHEDARAILRDCVESSAPWAVPWPCIHEFLAVVTNGRIFRASLSIDDAFDYIEALLAPGNLRLLSEGPGHLVRLRSLSVRGKVQGGAVHDARVAAICLDHGVREFWTADRDFSRFPELKCVNPLVRA